MYWLKGCPRCGGDLYVDRSSDLLWRLLGPRQGGTEWVSCLQCGAELNMKQGQRGAPTLATVPVERR